MDAPGAQRSAIASHYATTVVPATGPREGASITINHRFARGPRSPQSVGGMLLVSLAVHRCSPLLIRAGAGILHDPVRRVLVAVRCVLDQFLLGELKALGLASSPSSTARRSCWRRLTSSRLSSAGVESSTRRLYSIREAIDDGMAPQGRRPPA